MTSLISKDIYEASYKKLIKKAFTISIIVHLLIFLPAYIKSRTDKKRQYYSPVYSVNLVGKIAPVKKIKKKKVTKKAKAVVKKKKKKVVKKKVVKKAPIKIKTPEGLKYTEDYHKDKKEKPLKEDNETEKALEETLARIKENIAERDKIEATLKKISDQLKDKESAKEQEDKEEAVKEVDEAGKVVKDEKTIKGYGRLSRDMMNLMEKKYYNMIWKKIKDSWILPSGVSEKNKDLITIVVIKIEKNGSVSDIDIEESSKSPYYDQSVIRAIKKAEPFPKFIDGMNRDFFKVGIRFRPTEK
jgi:TonB family protein